MRILPVTVLLVSLTLLSSAPAVAQSGSARGASARGATSTPAAARAVPDRTTTGSPRSATVREQPAVTTPAVPVRDGTTSTRIPYANYDPFYSPPLVGTVQRRDERERRWHRDGSRDDKHRDYRYRDRYRYDPYYYDRHYFDPYSYPVIYQGPGVTRVVEVQSEVYVPGVVPATGPARYVTATEAFPRHASESCAIVTVLLPNHRGYWKEMRLPVAGALTTDELRRMLNARIDEGVAFTVRDAGGETLDIPARTELDRLVIDPCR